jgi:3-methyl-2-oxobutanoate hydroxymethyltransferase
MNTTERLSRIQGMKQTGNRIVCLTAYDASFARLLEQAGVDVILVGDSLGMVLQGGTDTLQVTMQDMVYHTGMVRRGLQGTLLIADMPYNSYVDVSQALTNARRLHDEAGADMVKLEGGSEVLGQVRAITDAGIAVCGHLGLQPQSVHKYGGYKVQGRNSADAERILADAVALERAGAGMIVLECIPRALAARITAALSIPTIGIGAGPDCGGQILVLYDVIGISGYIPKMANDFLKQGGNIQSAVRQYAEAVRSGQFPTAAQSFD